MQVAFVGIKRSFQEIPEGYREYFVKYHLEIPYYYARDGDIEVVITTTDYESEPILFDNDNDFSHLQLITEQRFKQDKSKYDVVIHWRKWFEDLYKPDAINVLHTCDHTYQNEWKESVLKAVSEGKLKYILCYRTWHQQNLLEELEHKIDESMTVVDMTLGVDTDIYKPDWNNKNPYHMLWSSDPGRGLNGAIELALKLYQKDKRFKLSVCYPDYIKNIPQIRHPAIDWKGCIPNGEKLWSLFNTCGILPYTSTFKEPSSRAHRQAMAAGSLVLYPPNMGSPSFLIENGVTGIVSPINTWVDKIINEVNSGSWKEKAQNARAYAVTENWGVQAKRFVEFFKTRINQ